MKITATPASRGRPRAFDLDEALDRALHVFWEKGFEGASLTDLTEAMGINRPSLYAAYGNKEEVFRKALARYEKVVGHFFREAVEQKTARGVVEHLLLQMAKKAACPENPGGCLLVRCNLSGGAAGEGIRAELAKRRAEGETMLRKRFEKARAEGDLPAQVNASDLARFISTFHQGMSVQAASGATCEQLTRVAKMALAAWPYV